MGKRVKYLLEPPNPHPRAHCGGWDLIPSPVLSRGVTSSELSFLTKLRREERQAGGWLIDGSSFFNSHVTCDDDNS